MLKKNNFPFIFSCNISIIFLLCNLKSKLQTLKALPPKIIYFHLPVGGEFILVFVSVVITRIAPIFNESIVFNNIFLIFL
jgi:hypothetical protein